MNTATLTTNRTKALKASDSASDLLDKLIFNNASVSVQQSVIYSRLILVAAFLFMLLAAFGIYLFYQEFNDVLLNPLYNPVLYGLFIVINGWFVFSGGTSLYKLFVFLKLKSIRSVRDESLPTTTVIVSVNNEGKHIYNTLMNLAKSDYPEDKVQLIAIDKGSSDNTWSWMNEAKNDLGDRVTILQQTNTMSTNEAITQAFKIGVGAVIVTVDKGAVIVKDTLRNLISTCMVQKSYQASDFKNIKIKKN